MEKRTVACDGCLLQIDPNDNTRTFLNGRWFFFCRTCVNDGTRMQVLRKVKKHAEN